MFINYIILTGVILSWKGNLFPQNGIINYASAELAKQKPSSLNSFSQEKQHIYDIELVKRIIGLKKLRERYRKRQYYEARQGLTSSKNYINSILKHKLWIKDPYRAASHFRYGRKRDFSEAAYEHGVFKVKNKNYFLWVESENDYISKEFGGEIEVKDPLKGLSDSEKKEKLKFITQTHKYNAPFRDTKATNFLRGVYYSFLSKSKNTSISQLGKKQNGVNNDIEKNEGVINAIEVLTNETESVGYLSKLTALHTYIGVLERTPEILKDDIFPHFIPSGCSNKLIEFYYDNVIISKEEGFDIFLDSFFPQVFKKSYNPSSLRLNEISGCKLMTFTKKKNNTNKHKPEHTPEILNIIASSYKDPYKNEITNDVALREFTKKTGCTILPAGNIVNPNAPYLIYHSHALTYCRGEIYMIKLTSPTYGRKTNLTNVIRKYNFIKIVNNEYKIKKTHRFFTKIQIGLAIMKLRKCFYIIHAPYDNGLEIIELESDEKFIKKITKELNKVYFHYALPEFYRLTQKHKNKKIWQ
ncbi:uncharacterized protein LOC142326558 isoform X1 [Lycorma delicatula]|uniref:uncharacterized protein LOC142326558 isoform X1 n=1 Tax=Lycorma delicatula TaxID=130591 RepID=UPI003F513E25